MYFSLGLGLSLVFQGYVYYYIKLQNIKMKCTIQYNYTVIFFYYYLF